ncbi:MAG TPA: HAMP domain-containing sensor histidine kinase [Nitrososphaeraceae archaeon]|nr:HAMP domain-containing sensor histidine kinase [Nitrososphaeraceae archaeon]
MTNEHFDITQVLYGDYRVKDTLSRFLSKQNGIDLCSDSRTAAQVLEIYKKVSSEPNNEKEIKIRFLTDINADNILFCKELMKIPGEVRHLSGIKTNFAVRSREYISIATLKEELLQVEHRQQKNKEDDEGQHHKQSTQSQSHIIYSNIKGIIEQQQRLFNRLWENAVPAEQRIKELDEDAQSEFFKVITDNKKISQILIDLTNSVGNEVLLLLPNDKALVKIDKLGIINSLINASQKRGVNVKIICPLSIENITIQKKISSKAPAIGMLNGVDSQHGMYIVDNIKFLRIELVKPDAEDFLDAIGFAIYSNNERSVELFRWMFKLLWNERIQGKESIRDHKTREEFVSMAAHELSSPAQSILGYTELLLSDPKYAEVDKEQGSLEAIYRNSIRLSKLTKELLDLTRIENQKLQLHKQRFNLKDIIPLVIQDIQKQRQLLSHRVNRDDSGSGGGGGYSDVSIILLPLSTEEGYSRRRDIFVEADVQRVEQVLTNLLDNAIKFNREKGNISINIQEGENDKGREAIVSIRDNGMGIDPEIMPKLFTKFSTRSLPGTRGIGLGLYISKNIIEAHGGRIWAENNTPDKGATFSFSLPLSNNNDAAIYLIPIYLSDREYIRKK